MAALINKTPHPNAVKLALNGLLSREGRIAYPKIFTHGNDGPDSLRIDIPKDKVPRGTGGRRRIPIVIRSLTARNGRISSRYGSLSVSYGAAEAVMNEGVLEYWNTGVSGMSIEHLKCVVVAAVLLLECAVHAGEAARGQAEWEQTLAAAKKEGQVNIYIYRYERLLQDFRKEYPWLNVVSVTGRGSELTTRIMAERRAGKYIADVYSGGTNGNYNVLYKGKVLDPIKPMLILPEVIDTSKWYGGEHRYADAEGKYIFAYLANPSGSQLAHNSTLVAPKEFKSYWDVTRPKWKGKIVSLDPRDTGLGATLQFFYYNPELGPEFIKKFFGSMDLQFAKNFRQMTDWLAQGKFAICMGCKDSMRAKNQGLPVDDFDTTSWQEGTSFSSGGGSLSLLHQAPHPNAAKVFINWFLSRKGQLALQRLGDPDDPPNSRRIDIAKDEVPEDARLRPGVKYFDVVKPEYGDMKPIFDLAKEIMQAKEAKK